METCKTTGHFNTLKIILLLLSLVAPMSLAPVGAVELALTTANDPVSGNRKEDDLYTAALGFDIEATSFRLALGERMFTDREQGVRFDETYLEVTDEIGPPSAWMLEGGVGLLRVGEGFLGESTQNWVHRAVGSEEVHLAYPDETALFGTARVNARRLFLAGSRYAVTGRAEAFTAPGFRSWVRAEVAADFVLAPQLALRAAFGARADEVENNLLRERIGETGPTWELGLSWRRLFVRWTSNESGTHTRHVTLGWRVPLGPSVTPQPTREAS
jgi:hypothetical protein